MSANLPVTCTSTLAISTAPGSAVSPAPHALSPSLPVASQTHVISSGKANLPDTIKQAEQQIALYGPGPHTPQQKEELSKLNTVLFKCREIQKGKAVASSESSLSSVMLAGSAGSSGSKPPGVPQTGGSDIRVLDKRRLQELVKEVDPLEQLDDDVEEVLLQIADDFIESVVTNACSLAKHRKSSTLEAKDVQLHLERNWNMWIPGFGAEELRPYKKAFHTEAHKQRMALIKKTLKKY